MMHAEEQVACRFSDNRTLKIRCWQAMHTEREADLAAMMEIMLNQVPDDPSPRDNRGLAEQEECSGRRE